MTEDDRRRLVEAAPCFGVRLLRSARPDRPVSATRSEQPERWDLPGARIDVLSRFGRNDDDLVLMGARLEPGFRHPPLGFADGGGVFVVQGAVDHYQDGSDWRSIGPDDALHLPPGRRHAIRNTQDCPATLLVVATVRAARFVAEASALLSRSAAPDPIVAFKMLAARTGITLVPPATSEADIRTISSKGPRGVAEHLRPD